MVRNLGRITRGKVAALGVFFLALGFGAHLGILRVTGNFHEVVPGEVYRSAQPTAERIVSYKAQYGIKTIINLRGSQPGSDWYQQELAVSRKLDISHVDFRMSSKKVLTEKRAAEIVAILKTAKKPILVHCNGGADRSGLISALYLAVNGHGEKAAEAQISVRFGHMGIPFLSKTFAIDESFEQLRPWLGFNDSSSRESSVGETAKAGPNAAAQNLGNDPNAKCHGCSGPLLRPSDS